MKKECPSSVDDLVGWVPILAGLLGKEEMIVEKFPSLVFCKVLRELSSITMVSHSDL